MIISLFMDTAPESCGSGGRDRAGARAWPAGALTGELPRGESEKQDVHPKSSTTALKMLRVISL
jgi:hypothetical protein